MHVVVVTPPEPVVELDEAKAQLRVDFDDDNDLIEGLVAAATEHLDGPDGYLRRAIGAQVLKATIEGFPYKPLYLPLPPVSAITSITYIDADGVLQTAETDDYELTADGRLRLGYGKCWPTPRRSCDPVEITYEAGYAAVPKPIRQAVLLMVGDLYANRETVTTAATTAEIPMSATVRGLLSRYRLLRV